MTQDELDRVSVLLDDAHRALDEAWQIALRADDRRTTNDLVIADVKVLDVCERLGIGIFTGVVERIAAYFSVRV